MACMIACSAEQRCGKGGDPPRRFELCRPLFTMLKGVIIVNNQGKVRLAKFYEASLTQEVKQQLIRESYQMISKRSFHVCNFLEGKFGPWGKDTKLIYRHYATLYFIFVVDSSESELGILDLMQVFVEALDKCFENVCELDLVFRSDQVQYILEEVIMGGMVLETNLSEILEAVEVQKKMDYKDPMKGGMKSLKK